MVSRFNAIDSLIANEFAVELDGEALRGVFRVADFCTFKLDEQGKRVKERFTLAKMVQRDGNSPFNKWLRETIANRDSGVRPTRTLALLAIDDGIETRRWTIQGAYIREVRYSEFNSASFEMVEEIYTIEYEDIEEGWPATPDLE